MTTSFIRRLGVALSIAMLVSASAAQASERTVWMRFAGVLLQNMEQTEIIVNEEPVVAAKGAVHVRASAAQTSRASHSRYRHCRRYPRHPAPRTPASSPTSSRTTSY